MSNDFALGSYPIPDEPGCVLTFHQYVIYDSVNWTQSGVVRWNATTKQFEVQPDVPPSEILAESTEAVNSQPKRVIPKKIQKK